MTELREPLPAVQRYVIDWAQYERALEARSRQLLALERGREEAVAALWAASWPMGEPLAIELLDGSRWFISWGAGGTLTVVRR